MMILNDNRVLLILILVFCQEGLTQKSYEKYKKPESTSIYLDSETVDVDSLRVRAKTLENMVIRESVITWRIGSEPVFFPKLRSLHLQSSQINPHSINFGDNLSVLLMKKSNIANGTADNLWERNQNLRTLDIQDVENLALKSLPVKNLRILKICRCNIVWSSDDKPVIFSKLERLEISESHLNPSSVIFSDALRELIIESNVLVEVQVDSLPTKSLENLQLVNCTVTWNGKEPAAFLNLERLSLKETQIEPHSITFSDQLTEMVIETCGFTNETISDLWETATHLNVLRIVDLINIVQVNSLPTTSLEILQLVSCTVAWNGKEPAALWNLEELVLKKSQIDASSVTFSDRLTQMEIETPLLINGTISDLLRTASNLNVLLIVNIASINVKFLPFKNLRRLELTKIESVTWCGNGSALFANLEEFTIDECKINPQSITFSEKLSALKISSVSFVGGNLVDFLKTAANVVYLDLGSVDIDISVYPHVMSLTHITLTSSKIHCSLQVVFPNVKTLMLSKLKYLDENTFCKFSETFPNIETLNSFNNVPLIPRFVMRVLDCSSLLIVRFLFDLNPETKSYEYGILIKNLLSKGLHKYIPENYFSRPNDFPNFRFHIMDIRKIYKENGTYDMEIDSYEYLLPWKYYKLAQVEKHKSSKLKIMVFLYILFLAVFLTIGAFGNVISGYVLVQMQRRKGMSAGLILLSLTVYDYVVIFTYSMNSVFNVNLFYEVFTKSSLEYDTAQSMYGKEYALGVYTPMEHPWISHQDWLQAHLTYPLNKIAYTGSVYSIVLISIERFIAICYPLKSKLLLSSRNLKVAVLAVFLFSVSLNMTRWIETHEWDIYSTSSSWNEYYKPTFMRMKVYKLIYHGVIWTLTMYVLPFVLVGILNFKLSRYIVQANRNRAAMRNTTEENDEDSSVTKMLLCVVGVFVVCNSVHIAIVFYFFMAYDHFELSTVEAISSLPLIVIIVNSSVNFIIYIMMGKTLRKEFIKLIPKCIRSRFNPSNTQCNRNYRD